jgi:hypothetical protein
MNSSLQKKTKNGGGDISSRASQWGPKGGQEAREVVTFGSYSGA